LAFARDSLRRLDGIACRQNGAPHDHVIGASPNRFPGREHPALVVCPGGSIRVMLSQRDPRGLSAFHDFKVPNVGVVAL